VHDGLGAATESLGNVMLHPAAFAGMNAVVAGPAKRTPADGGCAPKESGTRVVHVNVVVFT
jgi:hypothetical protein